MINQTELQEAVKNAKSSITRIASNYIENHDDVCRIDNTLVLLNTALADSQKELEQVKAIPDYVSIIGLKAQVAGLEKERDKANERLAKVEKMFMRCNDLTEGKETWQPYPHIFVYGPTFLEAIDNLKI